MPSQRRFRLREGVIQDDVDHVGDGNVGVQLGDHYAMPITTMS